MSGATRVRRVGLVADSHVGEFIDAMPAAAADALRGCDVILHAGDLSTTAAIDALEAVAPVVAVRGDHDIGLDHLPRRLVVDVGGWRIGLTHGSHGRPWDTGTTLAQCAAGRRLAWEQTLHRHLVATLGRVDAVVYGHWHVAAVGTVGSVLCVNPGAVCPWGSLEGGRGRRAGYDGLADRVVRRFRTVMGSAALRPSVAVLDVGSAGLRVRHVPLPTTG